MDECDALGARRTSRSVHGLSFSLSPPRRNGWLIRQRISDVASRKPEPDCDGPVGLEGRGAAITGTAMPGAAETSVEGNYGGLCRGRRSNASCRGIGEIANRLGGGRYDGNDDLDTAAITEDDAVNDGMEAQEREDVTLELCIVDTVRPHLVRAGAGERRQHDEADQERDDCDGSAHHVSTVQEPQCKNRASPQSINVATLRSWNVSPNAKSVHVSDIVPLRLSRGRGADADPDGATVRAVAS